LLSKYSSFAHLERQAKTKLSIASLCQDETRAKRLSFDLAGIYCDFTKQCLSSDQLDCLLELAYEAKLSEAIKAMFSGKKINTSEERAVMHVALRDIFAEQHTPTAITQEVRATLSQIEYTAELLIDAITAGEYTDIVCLGIGGSVLGPKLFYQVAKTIVQPRINIHFISNTDPYSVKFCQQNLDSRKTLCLVCSKTFTTAETLHNANKFKSWYQENSVDISKVIFAATASIDSAIKFGISKDNIFEFWSWVGGRYSVWSAVSFACILSFGLETFKQFLLGANVVDRHFYTTELDKNVPVIMALSGIWNINFLDYNNHAVIPYADALEMLPNYLQQLEMESNGKKVSAAGLIDYQTAPIIWGGVGSDCQHAFMQLLHQGPKASPIDFIIAAKSHDNLAQQNLLANCFAQSRSLMLGNSLSCDDVANCSGNRPSSTFLLPQLNPYTLGAILAMYEHKVFVQGTIWGINSFDQWGVQLGKQIAQQLLPKLSTNDMDSSSLDLSTRRLLNKYREFTGST